MKKTSTCILVVNGTKARFFFNEGPNRGLKPRPDLDMTQPPLHARDIQADKPGRSFDSGGQGRHAMEYPTEPERVAERRFLGEVLVRLEELDRDGAFDRLVLAAPPRVLGDLRQLLPRGLASKVYADVNKDLTHFADQDLPDHLADVIVL
jgi:protein required for attachment to host cells